MKHKTILLLLLAIVITTGCSKREQTSVSNPTEAATTNLAVENSSTECDVYEEVNEKTTDNEITTENSSDESLSTEFGWFFDDVKEYSADNIMCDPIDKSVDCEAIILEKADRLHTLIYYYLNNEEDELVYEYGDETYTYHGTALGARIISDEMASYSDFKLLFSDCIYGDYFDWINRTSMSTLFDVNGVLYGHNGESGIMGIDETWYLGYDVQDDRIVGHFAALRGLGESSEKTSDYLNDESNYWFYDITVQCVNGAYVITSCREITSGRDYDYSDVHGIFYNSGFADRSLITNEKVAPKVF